MSQLPYRVGCSIHMNVADAEALRARNDTNCDPQLCQHPNHSAVLCRLIPARRAPV